MSLTKPIPEKMRNEMSKDKFYKKCCVADKLCKGVIQWHHAFYFMGQRVNEPFCIIPVCEYHHSKASVREIKEKMDWVVYNRATDEQLIKYSKAINYINERKRLNNIYGIYKK